MGEKREMQSKHAFELLIQELTSQTEQAEKDRGDKSQYKAKQLQNKADASSDLTDTTSVRDDDQAFLKDLTATCSQKANDFDSRQQLRKEELEAIQQAVDILSSNAVSGNAVTHLPSLVQSRVLAQLRAS